LLQVTVQTIKIFDHFPGIQENSGHIHQVSKPILFGTYSGSFFTEVFWEFFWEAYFQRSISVPHSSRRQRCKVSWVLLTNHLHLTWTDGQVLQGTA